MQLPDRLRRPADFRRCYGRGAVGKNRLVAVHAAGAPDGHTRVGFAVSRKVGTAVVRNRVKRLLREAVRQQPVPLREGVHVVVSARVAAREATLDELKLAVGRLLERGGLLAGGEQRRRRAKA